MDITWRNNHFKSRQLISLVFSVFIILLILTIPIEYEVNVNRQDKFIDISLVKNNTTEIIPDTVQFSPVESQVNPTQRLGSNVPVIHRKTTSGMKAKHSIYQPTQQMTSLNPQKTASLSGHGKQSFVKKSRSQLVEIDNNSLVDTEKKDSFKHQLLDDKKKKRLAMMEALRQELSKTRQSKMAFDMPAIIVTQPNLIPVTRKKKGKK